MVEQFAWFILLLPLLAALLIAFFFLRQPRLSAQFSIGAVVLAFVFSLFLLIVLRESRSVETAFTWLTVGNLKVEMGLRLD